MFFFKNTSDDIHTVTYKFVVEHAANLLGVSPKKIVIQKGKYGKPYLKKYASSLQFSISYSNNASVVVFAKENIGIDIELIGNIYNLIFKNAFSKKEKNYVLNCSDKGVLQKRFYEVWTKKEAYLKWLGTGLTGHLQVLDVFDKYLFPHFYSFCYNNFIISIYNQKDTKAKIEFVKINS